MLDSPIDVSLKGRPNLVQLYQRLGIKNHRDLVHHLPRSHEDLTEVLNIADIKAGRVVIKAEIIRVYKPAFLRRGLSLSSVNVSDGTGSLHIIWFNQPYRSKSLKAGEWYYFAGEYGFSNRRLQMTNPTTILVDEDKEPDLIKPVYRLTKGLKQIDLRRLLKKIEPFFDEIVETLPPSLLQDVKLQPLRESLWQVHFGTSMREIKRAQNELDFRALLIIAISSRLLKRTLDRRSATPIALNKKVVQEAIQNLPFNLTKQQDEILNQLLTEMAAAKRPLNYLLQGDVGGGKTVVALLLALNVIKSGYQVVFLAPTQILAQQHYRACRDLLGDFLKEYEVDLLTSNLPDQEQKELRSRLLANEIKLIIGTHSLFNEAVAFRDLALIIIDEQQLFGVQQRLKLVQKAKASFSNVLSLSATPIPRSLALVIYADMTLCSLSEKPAGRLSIQTKIIGLAERGRVLKKILLTKGPQNQIYVICPSIEREEGDDSIARVVEYFLKLEANLKHRILHSRIASEERDQIMADFKEGRFDVLFCTSIIGAGVDLPNVNTIIIISPEKFGLAQLHQMRGRVGRGQRQGYCYLCPFSNQMPSSRLQALLKYEDGFKLSDIDLRLRGPGALYGTQQSGALAIYQSGLENPQDLKQALQVADKFVKNLKQIEDYPLLKMEINKYQHFTHLN